MNRHAAAKEASQLHRRLEALNEARELAAGALAFAGIVLSPAAGAVLMSASTIVVALNAQLLRRLKLNPADVC